MKKLDLKIVYVGAEVADVDRLFVQIKYTSTSRVLIRLIIHQSIVSLIDNGANGILNRFSSLVEDFIRVVDFEVKTQLIFIEERTVGPSLGQDSIAAGQKAVIVGIIAVMFFMIIAYGRFGLFSDIALIMNIVFIIALLSIFNITLTLPGIAGIVLTIGMAVDANILIFERIKEELHNGNTAYGAIDKGFTAAFRTIIDSNITTLVAALILFYFGSGPVKGFAVTLSIGIASSMFSAISLTRLMVISWFKNSKLKVINL